MAEETRGNSVTTTSGRSASSDESGIFNILEEKLLNVVETTLIDSLSEQLARRLCKVGLKLRHVDIINKEDLLGVEVFGSEQILTLEVKVTFKGILKILAGCFTREVNEGRLESIIRCHKEIFNDHGFTNTSLTGEKHVVAVGHKLFEQVLVLDGIVGRNQDIEEVSGGVVNELWDLLGPRLKLVRLEVNSKFKDITIREFMEVISNLSSDEFTEHVSAGIVQISTE